MGATARIQDFSKVKDGGNFNKKRIKAGDYLATIIKVEDAVAKDDVPQYLFTIKVDKHPSGQYPYYCKLAENQLWKLRNIFIAAGKTVPKSKQRVDPNTIVGKKIGVTMDDAEWDEKEQSEVSAVFPSAELSDDTGVDDDETVEDDDEDTDDGDLDDLDDTEEDEEEEAVGSGGDQWDAISDRTELRKALKKVAPDVKTTTSMTEDDIRNLIRENSAEEAEEEEEEEEEEEAPAPKPAAKKKTTTKKKVEDVSDDELEELDIDDM